MTSASKNARVAGLLYIFDSVFGVVYLLYIPNTLIVQGNAASTANNIVTHESLFRFGMVSELLCAALWVFVTLALYRLLKGVDQGLARLMVILGLMPLPVYVVNTMTDAAALLFARGPDFLSVFSEPQRYAFAMLFLHLHDHLVLAYEMLGAPFFVPFGVLVYRSRFLPRILGVWLMIVCFAYLALGFSGILFPTYKDNVAQIAQPVLFGEVAIMLWLVVMGARLRPTEATASSSAAG